MRTLDVRDAPPHHTPTNTFHRPTHDDERGKDNGEEASMDLVGARRLCDEAEYGIQHRSNGGKLMDPLEVVRSDCRSMSIRGEPRRGESVVPGGSVAGSKINEEDGTVHSSTSGDDDDDDDAPEVDGDEFLFQLAAFDEEWRTRMVETLEASSILNDRADDGGVISAAAAPNDPFHSLLFGTTEVASIVTEKKTDRRMK